MAGDSDLEIVVKMVDEASKQLNEVKEKMQELSDAGEEGTKSVSSFSDSLDAAKGPSVAFAGALAAAGVAVLGFGVVAINAARESALVQNQLEAVLQSTGHAAGVTAEQANALATAFSRTSNFGDEAVLSGENLLLTFTNVGKDVFPLATQAMVDMATAMGTDVSGQAIQLGKALNDPINGISALTRVGVTFTDEQKKMIESLQTTGDVGGAQMIILNELMREFGGSAEASVDPILQIKNQVGEFAEAIGGRLLPYVNDAANAMLAWFDAMGGVEGILAKIEDKVNAVTGFLSKHQEIIYIVSGAIIGALVPAIWAGVLALYALATAAWAAFVPLLPYIIVGAAIGGAIFLIVKGVQAVIALLPEFIAWWKQAWDGAKEAVSSAMQAVQTFVIDNWNKIVTGVKDAMQAVQEAVTSVFTAVVDWIIGALQTIGDFFTSVWEGFVDVVTTVGEAIGAAAQAVWDVIVTIFQFAAALAVGIVIQIFAAFGIDIIAVLQSAIAGIIGAWNALVTGTTAAITALVTWLTQTWSTIATAATEAWNAITAAITSVVSTLVDWFMARFTEVRDFLVGIWTEVRDFFVGIWNDISSVVSGKIAEVSDTVTTTTTNVQTWWNKIWDGISSKVSMVWATIKSAVLEGMTAVYNGVMAGVMPIYNAFKGMWDGATALATTAWEGIKNVVKAGINWVIDKINALIKAVNSAITAGAGAIGIKAITIPLIPALAKGGNIIGEGDVLVGENGPERLTLPRGARVTPLSGDNAAGGGTVINISINHPNVLNDADIVEKIGDPIVRELMKHFAVT